MSTSSSHSSIPLHLLPPHIKLQILNSLQPQPTQPPQPHSHTNSTATNDTRPSTSSTVTSAPSSHFNSPPLFALSALTPTTPLPLPFTFEALTRLHTHGHCTIDNFLPQPTLATRPLTSLQPDITQLVSSGAFTQGRMLSTDPWKATHIRGDMVCWLSPDRPLPPSIQYVLAELHSAVQRLAGVLTGMPCVASASQLALYEAGRGYVRHLDVRRGGDGPVRRLTAIVYLNEGWQAEWGGQLRLYERCGVGGANQSESEESVDVLPVYGRLLLFASEEVEHEVLPSTERRVALTTWFK